MKDQPLSAPPPRLAPFLAQWDYIEGVLFERLESLTDEEYLWQPVERMHSVAGTYTRTSRLRRNPLGSAP